MLQYPNGYRGPMLSIDGTGTYLIGQGDFSSDLPVDQAKIIMIVGTNQITYAASLYAGTWHHLAVVRRLTLGGSILQMYLDGVPVGLPLNLPSSWTPPAGRLRFGKNTFDAALDGGGAQYYGILDDVAIFRQALRPSRIAQLASALHLSGNEDDLYAGYVFGYIPPSGLDSKLTRPISLVPGASIRQVS